MFLDISGTEIDMEHSVWTSINDSNSGMFWNNYRFRRPGFRFFIIEEWYKTNRYVLSVRKKNYHKINIKETYHNIVKEILRIQKLLCKNKIIFRFLFDSFISVKVAKDTEVLAIIIFPCWNLKYSADFRLESSCFFL